MSEEKSIFESGGFREFQNKFTEAMDEIEAESEQYWNSLTSKQQLDVFCAVSRRIRKSEMADKRSYRGTLYEGFGFGPESYVQAQMAGYLDIHNSIYDSIELENIVKDFLEKEGIDNIDDRMTRFYKHL